MRLLFAVVVLIAPILADQCDYKCTEGGGCTSKYLGTKPGKKLGSCFPKAFGGKCIGIPDDCSDCNKVITDCSGGSDADDGTGCTDSWPSWKCRDNKEVGYCTGSSAAILNCKKTCGFCGTSSLRRTGNCKIEDLAGDCINECFGGFSTGAKPNGVTVCGCRGNECYVKPKCKNWQDEDGNCLDDCFGGFSVGATSDGGKVCGCRGNECYVDPCYGLPVCSG